MSTPSPQDGAAPSPGEYLPSLRDMDEIAQSFGDISASYTPEELEELDRDLGLRPRKKRKKVVRRRDTLPPELARKMGLANTCYIEQKFARASKLLLEIIQEAPFVAAPYNTLGLVYEELGRHKDALQVYVVAAHFTSKDPDVWRRLSDMAEGLEEYDLAIHCLSRILRMNIDDGDALWQRSMLYEKTGDIKRAIDGFKSLIAKRPHDREVVKKLSHMCFQIGKHSRAQSFLESFLDWARSQMNKQQNLEQRCAIWDLTIVNMLCELYLHDEMFTLAHQLIEETIDFRVCARLPPEISVRKEICALYMNETSEPDSLLNQLASLEAKKFPELFIEVGDALYEHQHYRSALQVFASLESETEFDNADLWIRQARCYKEIDQEADRAIRYCNKVLEGHPGDVECSTMLADLYNMKGDPGHAIALLEDAGLRLLQSRSASSAGLPMDDRMLKLFSHTAQLYIQESKYQEMLDLCFESVKETLNVLITSHDQSKREKMASFPQSLTSAPDKRHRIRHLPTLMHDGVFLELSMHLVKALVLFKQYDDAIDLLKSLFRFGWTELDNPEKLMEFRSLAVGVFFNCGLYHEAYSQLSHLILAQPNDVGIANLFGVILSRTGYPEKCRRFLERSLSKHPSSVPMRVLYGHAALLKRSYGTASRHYLRAWSLAPSDVLVTLYAGIGLLHRSLSPSIRSRHICVLHSFSFFFRYLHLRQGSIDALYNMGRAFHSIGIFHIAMRYYEEVLSMANRRSALAQSRRSYHDQQSASAPALAISGMASPSTAADLIVKESAHNLALIHKRSGNDFLARRLLIQYIVF